MRKRPSGLRLKNKTEVQTLKFRSPVSVQKQSKLPVWSQHVCSDDKRCSDIMGLHASLTVAHSSSFTLTI